MSVSDHLFTLFNLCLIMYVFFATTFVRETEICVVAWRSGSVVGLDQRS